MKISEVFSSVQGEGPRTGRQTIFVRLSGCNMKPLCAWCDTKFAEEGTEMTIPQVRDKMIVCGVDRIRDITFTGGEPLLQRSAIIELLGEFPATYHSNYETNGTICCYLPGRPTIIISPKLSNAKVNLKYDEDWNSEIGSRDIWYKFVVANEDDVLEAMEFCTYNLIPRHRIFIMPECTTQAGHVELWPFVFNMALKYKVNASPRLQTLAFGSRRGI